MEPLPSLSLFQARHNSCTKLRYDLIDKHGAPINLLGDTCGESAKCEGRNEGKREGRTSKLMVFWMEARNRGGKECERAGTPPSKSAPSASFALLPGRTKVLLLPVPPMPPVDYWQARRLTVRRRGERPRSASDRRLTTQVLHYTTLNNYKLQHNDIHCNRRQSRNEDFSRFRTDASPTTRWVGCSVSYGANDVISTDR